MSLQHGVWSPSTIVPYPGRDRPMSSHFPMGHGHINQPVHSHHPQLTPQNSSPMHPMVPGGNQGGFQRYPAPSGPRPIPPPLSSSGPEKPQRQYSYELDGPSRGYDSNTQATRLPEIPGKIEPGRTSQTRVRFQDPQTQVYSFNIHIHFSFL